MIQPPAAMDPVLELRAAIRDIPDFPQEGIVFRDITPVLADGMLFRSAIQQIVDTTGGAPVDKVVGIDARGFIFAAAVADRLGAGFVPVRKKGKLPWRTRELSYTLEYGEAVVEIHDDAVRPGEQVLLVDDLLATGGTASAAVQLLDSLGAELVAVTFLIELCGLHGRDRLGTHRIESIIAYD